MFTVIIASHQMVVRILGQGRLEKGAWCKDFKSQAWKGQGHMSHVSTFHLPELDQRTHPEGKLQMQFS